MKIVLHSAHILLLLQFLLPLAVNAQRLNAEGQKMVSRIRTASQDTIFFEYDTKDMLKRITVLFTDYYSTNEKVEVTAEDKGNGTIERYRMVNHPIPSKVVYTRSKYEIVESVYKDGIADTSIVYKWKIDSDNSRIKQYTIHRNQESNHYSEISYKFTHDYRGRLESVRRHSLNFQGSTISYAPGITFYTIEYGEEGYVINYHSFSLNKKEIELPYFVDYLDNHTWIGNEPASDERWNIKNYVYGNDMNDTNMNLNSLFELNIYPDKTDRLIFNHIMLHTEWSGLKEKHSAKECQSFGGRINNYEIVYRRDAEGNIRAIIYSKNGEYNPKKDIVYIDYVEE